VRNPTPSNEVRAAQAEGALDVRTLAQDRKELGDGRFTFINIQVVTSTGTVMLYATFPNDNEALRSTRSTRPACSASVRS
jgi:multidrug efflux pump subunit AcrA (membrane-fusion protein)